LLQRGTHGGVEASVTNASGAAGSECIVEWRVTNSPCILHPDDGMRVRGSGTGVSVKEWCLGSSSVGQKLSINSSMSKKRLAEWRS
jgi:hypothetical protein